MAPNGFLHAASVIALADTSCGYGAVDLPTRRGDRIHDHRAQVELHGDGHGRRRRSAAGPGWSTAAAAPRCGTPRSPTRPARPWPCSGARRWCSTRSAAAMRRGTDPWGDGPLLPPGWRPDREPRNDADDHRWVVVDPAGRLRLADGTVIALRPLRPGDGALLAAGFDRLSQPEPLPALPLARPAADRLDAGLPDVRRRGQPPGLGGADRRARRAGRRRRGPLGPQPEATRPWPTWP